MSDALIMSLPHVVDMALHYPEVGAVNFNLLNTVLQVVIHQLKLDDCTVEIRDPGNEYKQLLAKHPRRSLSVNVSNYAVNYDPRKNDRGTKKTSNMKLAGSKEKIAKVLTDSKKQKEPEKTWNIVVVESAKSIDRVEKKDSADQPHIVVPVSDERFQKLESDIDELNEKMKRILELPADSNIIEALKSAEDRQTVRASSLAPASEMWQLLSLTKRMDAAEAGIKQLTATIDAFVNEVNQFMYQSPRQYSKVKQNEAPISEIENAPKTAQNVQRRETDSRRRGSRPSIFMTIMQRLESIEKQIDYQPDMRGQVTNYSPQPEGQQNNEAAHLTQQMEIMKRNLSRIEKHMSEAWARLEDVGYSERMFNELIRVKEKVENVAEGQENFTNGINKKIKELSNIINNIRQDTTKPMINDKLEELSNSVQKVSEEQTKHAGKVQKNVSLLEHKLNSLLKPNEQINASTVSDLVKQVTQIQGDVQQLYSAAKQFSEGQTDRKAIIDRIMMEIEDIKLDKADRLDMCEALVEKADADVMKERLNRKVSHHQFETVYDELIKSIADAATKLREQETLWYITLEEIQTAIANKIDKIDELEPLRHSVNLRIKTLQRYIRHLCKSKEEEDAAAAKKRIIREINCLSCDRPVTMKKFNVYSIYPTPPVVSDKPSMKPYLTYELDAVRTQKKCLKEGHNMNLYENALRQSKSPKERTVTRRWRPGHLCNRYCGGSNTITTAQQRVSHGGDCTNHGGPQVIPLKETLTVGSDGKVYKSTASIDASPRSVSSKGVEASCCKTYLDAARKKMKHRPRIKPAKISLETIREDLDAKLTASPPKEMPEPTTSTSGPSKVKSNENMRPKQRVESLVKFHINKQNEKGGVVIVPPKRLSLRKPSQEAQNGPIAQLYGDDLLDPLKNPVPAHYLPDPNKVRYGNRPDPPFEELVLVTLENYDHVAAIDRPIIPELVADRARIQK